MSTSLQLSPLQKPDIMAVMEREGIELKRRGRDFWAPCPFHDDKNPSFKVNPELQKWYCFSESRGGDVIDFIMKRRGVSFKEAVNILGIKNGKPAPPDPAIQRRKKLLQAFNEWRKDFLFRLSDEAVRLRKLEYRIQQFPKIPEEFAWNYAGAISRLGLIDYKLNLLAEGDQETLFSMYCEDSQNG